VRYKIRFTASAQRDLLRLYDYIADRSGPAIARGYVDRIHAYCYGFADMPKRGTLRDDLRPDLRVVGFERRVMIAFHTDGDLVVFDRILYGGRSLDRLSDDED
jgi:toxin ParE1/3/4